MSISRIFPKHVARLQTESTAASDEVFDRLADGAQAISRLTTQAMHAAQARDWPRYLATMNKGSELHALMGQVAFEAGFFLDAVQAEGEVE